MLKVKCDTQVSWGEIMEISKGRFCAVTIKREKFFCFFVYNPKFNRKFIINLNENEDNEVFFVISENLIDIFKKFGKYIIFGIAKRNITIDGKMSEKNLITLKEALKLEIQLIEKEHSNNSNFLLEYLKFKIKYLIDYKKFLRNKITNRKQISEINEAIRCCQDLYFLFRIEIL